MIRRFNGNRLGLPPLRGFALIVLIAGCLQAAESPRQQTRTHGRRVPVPLDAIRVEDGDTIRIVWKGGPIEVVRILGIDTPETQQIEHDLPFDQPFGPEATAFAQGVFAMAERVELLRAATLDPYQRTLGYVFVNDRNYSVLVLRARLAVETVSVFGDNGFPQEAADCLRAAEAAGPVPFEPPYLFRRRMREVAEQMRAERRLPPKRRDP